MVRRRVRRLWAVLTVLAVAWGGARAAVAQPLPDDMRPIVFLLVDTSASMEFTIGVEGQIPGCDPAWDGTRNRWLATMEVLTGSFEGLSCVHDDRLLPPDRVDYGYAAVKHVQWSWTNQRADGLLDLLKDDLAFALMTMDNNADPATDAGGDYSYFDDAPVGILGTDPLDLGMRNADAPAGGLVHAPTSDTVADLRAASELVQGRILPIAPYGGAYTGPALADILLYLENEPRLQPRTAENPLGDPFASCRAKNVVLVTDGRPTRDGQLGYQTAVIYASRLHVEFGVRVFVVSFDAPTPADLNALNAIADAGGTGSAYIARNQTQLLGQLAAVLGALAADIDSRTIPVVTNVTRNEPDDRQYRFWSARAPIPDNPVDREGFVEWENWSCQPDCRRPETPADEIDLCSVLDFSQSLALQGTRTIHTVVTDPAAGGTFRVEEVIEGNTALTPEVLQVPSQPDYPQIALFFNGEDYEMPFGHLIFERPDGTVDPARTDVEKRAEYVRQLIGWVRADDSSRRQGEPLGGVFRATPALQTAPPTFLQATPSYQFYANANRNRPNVLYVSTNDGQVHAFRADNGDELSAETGTEPGQELWSFLPGFALKRLHLLDDTAIALLDASPRVVEVLPLREAADVDPAEEAEQWRSVLLVPAGPTDRGLVALDVTKPVPWRDTMFLWEITHEGRCVGPDPGTCFPAATTPEDDFSKLGRTIAPPAAGTIFMNVGVAPKERDVVFIAGGDDPDDEGIGRVFYVADVMTGAKIIEFSEAAGNVFGGPDDASLDDYPLVGAPVAYSTALGQFVTRIFVGDAGGRMWRISLASPDPSDWRMDLFHDAFAGLPVGDPRRAPIFEQPTVAASAVRHDGAAGGRGFLSVLYSTGNIDQDGPEPLHTMYSLVEVRQDEDVVVADENWRWNFPEGEQPVGRPLIFSNVAYFLSYVQSEDLCDAGTSRVWGVDYMNTLGGELIPRLDLDGDPFLTPDDVVRYMEFPDTILTSISLIRVPSCTFTIDFSDVSQGLPPEMTGSMQDLPESMGGLQLVMQQTGTPPPDQAQPAQTPGGKFSEAKIAHQPGVPLTLPANQVIIQSWATIFD